MSKEIRVTIKSYYPEGCIGHKNVSARNGHYFTGDNLADCVSTAVKFLCETSGRNLKLADLDIQLWDGFDLSDSRTL